MFPAINVNWTEFDDQSSRKYFSMYINTEIIKILKFELYKNFECIDTSNSRISVHAKLYEKY